MSKKVLVVSNNSFSEYYNNGKTLESIFRGLEINDRAQIYFTQTGSPDLEFCKNYYCIRDKDIFNVFLKNKSKTEVLIKKKVESNPNSLKKILIAQKSLLRLFRDLIWATNFWKTDTLKNWCINQSPDYIFFVGGPGKFSYNVSLYISNLLAIPLVTFFTDDYLIYPLKKNIFDYIQYWRISHFYKKIVKNSSLCFTIGEMMSKEYSDYFNKDFYSIMNSIEIGDYCENKNNSTQLIVSYFGSIHTDRWKMIIRLAEFFNMNKFNNIKIKVYVASVPEEKILNDFESSGVIYMGALFGEDLKNAMLNSDILLHVECNNIYSKSITKLSVSTKMPEYLALGKPILGFGPKDVASMKVLSDNGIGVVISPDQENYQNIQDINKLLSDQQYRVRLGKLGYDYALEKFNNKKVTHDFYNKIDNLLNR